MIQPKSHSATITDGITNEMNDGGNWPASGAG
jgi:hypothetical protein